MSNLNLGAIETEVAVETTKRFSIKLTGDEIIHLVNWWRHNHGIGRDVPKDATVDVGVPGGGDWSNTSLDIDSHCPVEIRWTAHETTEG